MINTPKTFQSKEVGVRSFAELYEVTPQRHPFHLVNPSPWPLFSSIAALCLTTGGVLYMHGYEFGQEMLFLGLGTLIYSMAIWWRDVIREASFEGHHTVAVQEGHRMGMLLFIASEVMFFLGFFWAFFHSSLAPAIDIGATWPPAGIEVLSPWEIPFLNTLLLLSSGAAVTWTHHAILAGNRSQTIFSLIVTLAFAFLFTALQGVEYLEAPFSISDSVYGSTFFMATGFHGFHVLVGSLFLAVCLFRSIQGQFSRTHHVGFEAAAWYWHFVDVVWLFLFIAIYWWGGA